ncbi:hypothetical protein HanXRQr2_Chr16g0773791 [Helianthus annuus]|uniref:Uncharacterized protein n=1 Tax=Helianthus annuus TaxID=4232 RepID=A0A9K3DX50_HELAN|nr:hypothetical protein HanXRQr2_Chr16g0773791 [Helianthus annuus]
MNVSHPSVHPVEAASLPPADGRAVVPPRVRMKVIQGLPGTIGGLSLRFCQFAYAVVSLAGRQLVIFRRLLPSGNFVHQVLK